MSAPPTRRLATFLTQLLGLAWGVVGLGLGLTLLLLAVFPFIKGPAEVDAGWLRIGTTMAVPVAFTLDGDTHRIAAPSLGVPSAALDYTRGLLTFPTPTYALFYGHGVFVVALFSITLWVLHQLRAVLTSVRDGHPFIAVNAARIRWIGVGIVLTELMRGGDVLFGHWYARTYFTATSLRFAIRPDVNESMIVVGLIVVTIAEVFRTGARLDEEQSLTV